MLSTELIKTLLLFGGLTESDVCWSRSVKAIDGFALKEWTTNQRRSPMNIRLEARRVNIVVIVL
jgi:hypothetical protein